MAFDPAAFPGDLEHLRAFSEKKSALQASLFEALARDAAQGSWAARLAAAWRGRVFGPRYEAPLLLTAALHREALAGRAPELAARLPSCGGSGPGASGAAVAFLRRAPDAFFAALAPERLQTNEPARAAAWLLPACAAFVPRALPFHLMELGASAGLLLVGDYLPRATALLMADGAPAAEPERWRDSPYPILSRTGFDVRPRRVADAADRLWLESCIWPDDLERRQRFSQAADLFSRLERERAGPRLVESSFAGMPELVASRAAPRPEEGLLVFNTQSADFLPPAERRALADGLAGALEPWGDRALWIELELPEGDGERRHELRAHRWLDGAFQTRVLGEAEAHARALTLRPGWDFLRPLTPPAPPRNTREEPPKRLEPGTYRFGGPDD